MELRKLHMGTMSYGHDSMDEVGAQLNSALIAASSGQGSAGADTLSFPSQSGHMVMPRGRRDMSSRVKDVVFALALCHNASAVIHIAK